MASSRPLLPKKILPLPKEVVDRIAAGEVVQRPVSVVKELIENSLDADGSQIDVQIQRGGLDSITVTDNGIGISPRDLPLACTRFATSKLVHVDDLKSIKSFGFRGEALASASMVGRVSIVSRVRSRNDDVVNNNDNRGKTHVPVDDHRHHNCAYKMSYKDGAPNPQINPGDKPLPSAGKDGTSITVQDLFYNIPSRRRAFESGRSERDEYDKILDVVQRYAVHVAKRGVGFICRAGGGSTGGTSKKVGFGTGNRTDLNTQSLASIKKLQEKRKVLALTNSIPTNSAVSDDDHLTATKDVIGHIFGSDVTRELLYLSTGEGDVDAVSLAALDAMVQRSGNHDDHSSALTHHSVDGEKCSGNENSASKEQSLSCANSLLEEMMIGASENTDSINNNAESESQSSCTKISKFAFAYRATGFVTNGSYSAPKSSSAFLLFINDRLVESASIRRAVESVYCDTLPKGGKPFVYLSIELPGPHIDVNVHPTKREVAFLHEDRLCEALSKAVRGVVGSATVSRTFSVANGGRLLAREDRNKVEDGRNKLLHSLSQTSAGFQSFAEKTNCSEEMVVEKENQATCFKNNEGGDDDDRGPNQNFDQTPSKRRSEVELTKDLPSTKRPYDPSRLVRTNRSLPVGALEPFLVQKGVKDKGVTTDEIVHSETPSIDAFDHNLECPLANNSSAQQVDMSIPGAFALAICRCQVKRVESLPPVTNSVIVRTNIATNTGVRPKKITPTQCDYESIRSLRADITDLNHQGLNETLRGSTYVGTVSRSRSLIQHGINLIMINHRELAREMFYQIALLKFKGMHMAELGEKVVDVTASISQLLQFEEDLSSGVATVMPYALRVNKTNANLAKQAAACLLEKAPMLEEYFAIKFEKVTVDDKVQNKQIESICITGLPILLDGHSPQPHALPLFLFRLATEVDWTEETPCFKGVCYELASFYAEIPLVSSVSELTSTMSSRDKDSNRENDGLVDDEAKKYIKHTLFPAISFLLVPPKKFVDDGSFVKLADLNSLYKVFERC